MTQIIPAHAQLGRRNAKLKLGYRILNLDSSLFRAWTTVGVQETAPGDYVVAGGVEAPSVGGYIIWGEKNRDIVSAEIVPAQVDLSPAIDDLLGRIADLLPTPAPVVVDTQAFEARVERLRTDMATRFDVEERRQQERLAQARAQLEDVQAHLQALTTLAEAARAADAEPDPVAIRQETILSEVQHLLDKVSGQATINLQTGNRLEIIQAGMDNLWEHLTAQVMLEQQAERMKREHLAILDDFLSILGGETRRSDASGRFRSMREASSVNQKWDVLERLELRLQRTLAKAFRTQGQLFLKGFEELRPQFREGIRLAGEALALREAITQDDWMRIFDRVSGETRDLFFDPIQYGAGVALERGASAAVADVGIDMAFGLKNPRAVDYLNHHGYGLISQIDDVTRGNIATIVGNGAAEGWSYDKVAREIISMYSQMAVGKPQQHIDSRAHLIAVTEIGNAYEAGSAIVIRDLQDSGLQMEKKWLTVGDERVSDGCRENQNEGWILFSRTHQSGHMNPLRFPGCRCTELYRRRPSSG